jgi:excisionase family DNA binding protein
MGMVSIESPLLSTGEVAGRLGVSRQHVVDLCDRGDLIFVRVGSHRRATRSAVKVRSCRDSRLAMRGS